MLPGQVVMEFEEIQIEIGEHLVPNKRDRGLAVCAEIWQFGVIQHSFGMSGRSLKELAAGLVALLLCYALGHSTLRLLFLVGTQMRWDT